MGKGVQRTLLALSRQVLIFIPIITIMSKLFGLNGIIYAQAITDLLITLLSITMFIVLKGYLKKPRNSNSVLKYIR